MMGQSLYLRCEMHSESKFQMGQSVPQLQLSTMFLHPMTNSANSTTFRQAKFVPAEFKHKHLTDPPARLPKQHKNSAELLQPSLKKPTLQLNMAHLASQKSIAQREEGGKCTPKALQIDSGLPKLRQTNSTQCQSPKAAHWSHASRLQEFQLLKKLGGGRFGQVFLVRHRKTGFLAALKVISKQGLLCETQEETEKAINQQVREIKIQSFLNHPALVALYCCFSDQTNVYLLLELATDGHLFALSSHGHRFSEEAASIIVREVAGGVQHMHQKEVIHRDIKLENIVMSMGMAKICDFGWSVYCPKQFRSTLCGTPLYLSPEMLAGRNYNKKVDIWAIGAIAHELVTASDPFKIKNSDDLSRIITQDFQMQQGSPELRSFISFILRKNPAKRPDADTLLMHPFIQKYRDLQTSDQLCRLPRQQA